MKPFVEWDDQLSVGIEEIDVQHKVLVDLINKMHQAVHRRRGNDVIVDIMEQLGNYTQLHFTVEESLMRILNYPDYDDHKAEHDALLERLAELKQMVESGRTVLTFDTLHTLKVWLSSHILEEDCSYTDHFLMAGANSQLKKRSWVSRLWGYR